MNFSDLIGKTLVKIDGCERRSKEIRFHASDGSSFRLYHSQDCCETVLVEDVCGDVPGLIGTPIVQAYESTNSDRNEYMLRCSDIYDDSWTWTFYRLATKRGHVVIRWLGQSNGYYSERVDFEICGVE